MTIYHNPVILLVQLGRVAKGEEEPISDYSTIFHGPHTHQVGTRTDPRALATLLAYYESRGCKPRSESQLVAWACADLARSLCEVNLAKPERSVEEAEKQLERFRNAGTSVVDGHVKIGVTGLRKGVRPSANVGKAMAAALEENV